MDRPALHRITAIFADRGVPLVHHPTYAAYAARRSQTAEDCLVLSPTDANSTGAALDELQCACSFLPTLIAWDEDDIDLAILSVRRGAAFVCAPMNDERIAVKVDRALAMVRLSAEVRRLLSRLHHGFAQLSRREREVFLAASTGLEVSEIARQLGIRPRTAYIHRSNAMTKLGVEIPLELTAAAVELTHCCRTRQETAELATRLGPLLGRLRLPLPGTRTNPPGSRST